MVYVAGEMQRQGLNLPLMIGGATTSVTHTAVKIEPAYTDNSTIYVQDASRAVGVVTSLLGDKAEAFKQETKAKYVKSRTAHARAQGRRERLSIEDARANKCALDWDGYQAPRPSFLGTKTFKNYDLNIVRPYIDWTPFFATWELKGRYPDILEHDIYGKAARDLYRDAQTMLDKILSEKWVHAQVTLGFWPAVSDGDDIQLFNDETRSEKLAVFHTLRQQMVKSEGRKNYALSDFVAPDNTNGDYVGGFCVTAGLGEGSRARDFKAADDDYSAILFQALCDRLAEALAEHLHERVRREFWGYEKSARFGVKGLVAEDYLGIRPAPGYPAQPDHTEKATLFKLLGGDATGVTLTESFAMHPASSVSGLYFSHADSLYFGVGKIEKDQTKDYAKRKGMSLSEAERWLSPILNYTT